MSFSPLCSVLSSQVFASRFSAGDSGRAAAQSEEQKADEAGGGPAASNAGNNVKGEKKAEAEDGGGANSQRKLAPVPVDMAPKRAVKVAEYHEFQRTVALHPAYNS